MIYIYRHMNLLNRILRILPFPMRCIVSRRGLVVVGFTTTSAIETDITTRNSERKDTYYTIDVILLFMLFFNSFLFRYSVMVLLIKLN